MVAKGTMHWAYVRVVGLIMWQDMWLQAMGNMGVGMGGDAVIG